MEKNISAGPADGAWDWRLIISSLLVYVLAFNLIFFLQELFLVLPKALTPGLYPTLFHNNHTWTGHNPFEDLLQGTGALAIFVIGMLFAFALRDCPATSKTRQLFLFWMAYQGLFQSLPQVVIGAMNPSNDAGMAMKYLHFGQAGKMVAALCALAVMAAAGRYLGPRLLVLAAGPAQLDSRSKRMRFMFQTGTLPAFAGVVPIIPFRMPRNLVEVVLWPLIVAFAGTLWLQLSAWSASHVRSCAVRKPASIGVPLVALIILLLTFQLILRPGLRFY